MNGDDLATMIARRRARAAAMAAERDAAIAEQFRARPLDPDAYEAEHAALNQALREQRGAGDDSLKTAYRLPAAQLEAWSRREGRGVPATPRSRRPAR